MSMRRVLFGDKCWDCDAILTERNGVIKGAYLQRRCNECHKTRTDAVPSRTYEARAAQYVKWKFGISPKEYKEKLENQSGVCAICNETCVTRKRLSVDHDHKTGIIRDLLCHRCNMVLGLVKENEDLLTKLIIYVQKHAGVV